MIRNTLKIALLCLAIASTSMPALAASTTLNNELVAGDAICAVVHIDIDPARLKDAMPALRGYIRKMAQDDHILRVELLQQDGAANHFTLIEEL